MRFKVLAFGLGVWDSRFGTSALELMAPGCRVHGSGFCKTTVGSSS